jgi:hypothetical protein
MVAEGVAGWRLARSAADGAEEVTEEAEEETAAEVVMAWIVV